MNDIVVAVGALGALGAVFGAGLAIASKAFHVPVDVKVEEVRKALPGANCGACGFPGCDGLAEAIANGEAPVNACPVGGETTAVAIAGIMGTSAGESVQMVARVICNGTECNAKEKFHYEGIQDCRAASLVSGGNKGCPSGCLGFGTCEKVCAFGAITMEDGIAKIDRDKCTACEKCIEVCPKAVIDMVPYKQEVVIDCNTNDFGKTVKDYCKVGCIGCQICVKACPFDAIEFKNNLAFINYDKCTNCMLCAEKCPTNAIWANYELKKVADILEGNCEGCTVCAKNCPFEAITGERTEPHKVNKEDCIGCGVCARKCPFDAIEMKNKNEAKKENETQA